MSGIKTSGYFLGPGYQGLLTSEKSTTYLDTNNCRIYIISNLSSLYELDNDVPIWKNTNPTDSVVLDGVVMYDLVYNFLHNGLFIYYSNSEMKIMERPDTFSHPTLKVMLSLKIKNERNWGRDTTLRKDLRWWMTHREARRIYQLCIIGNHLPQTKDNTIYSSRLSP